MKRWIKRHRRLLLLIVCLLLISNGVYGVATAIRVENDLCLVVHTIGIGIFLAVILWTGGILGRFYAWWEKD